MMCYVCKSIFIVSASPIFIAFQQRATMNYLVDSALKDELELIVLDTKMTLSNCEEICQHIHVLKIG